METQLKPPRPPHGKRLLISQIDRIAQEEPDRPWIAVPIDDLDLTKGYKDITFSQFANAVNFAAGWLQGSLGLPSEGFPAFAYTGPPDYMYALLTAAAGKLGYQIIPFGAAISPAGQQRILEQKNCTVYLYHSDKASVVEEVQKFYPGLRTVAAPPLGQLMSEGSVEPFVYEKSWVDARNDPWIVFHTSGTTGFPKVITYTQQMLSVIDTVRGLDKVGDTAPMQYANSRMYLPMPPMHYVSMLMTLSATVWASVVPVYGPGGFIPSPPMVKSILKYSRADGAMLVPALIDALCRDPESLALLRNLDYIQYAGAPLNPTSGNLLSHHARVVPAIGSTDAGGYFVSHPNIHEDWDYVVMQPHTGAVMEHRVDDKYELVFLRNPDCYVQAVFETRPDLDRFETKDLWVEHPTKKGQWKIVGRSDDLINLSNSLAVFVSPIELALTEHPSVRNALIGGQGKPSLIMLIEPSGAMVDQVATDPGRASFMHNLTPHIEKFNSQHNEMIWLRSELVVFAKPDKPWPRTFKDTPIRSQVMKLYETEIESAYSAAAART